MSGFGDMLVSILDDKGWTISKLSKVANISRMHLHRIIKNKNVPSLYLLNELSYALKIDTAEYYKISRDFKNVEEYNSFKHLRELIECNATIDELEEAIKNIDCNQIDGIYKQLVYYIKAMILTKKYKQYKKSLDFCFKALNVEKQLFNINNLEKYIQSEVSFNILTFIEYNYYQLSMLEEGKELSLKLIALIEKAYFSEVIPNIQIPKMVYRAYISMLNNASDYFLSSNEYDKVILYCERGIDCSKKNNSIYGLAYLYDNMLQANYQFGHFESATKCYNKASAVCSLNEDSEHLERINKRVKEKYNKIWR